MTAPGMRRGQYALGFLAFLLLGMLQAAYGPSYPALVREYHLSVAGVGAASSLHFLGSALGTVLLGVLLRRLSLRSSLAMAAGALVLGLLGVAFAPLWSVLLAAALLGGLGFGMLSAGFNTAFAQLGAGPSSLVNGLFGVGSVASPVLVVWLATSSHRPPFLVMAALAAALAVGVRWRWPRSAGLNAAPAAQDGAVPPLPGGPLLALFGATFFLYVGLEAGLGNWATTYLTRLDHPHPALITSGYWAALTAGRFLFALVGRRLAPLPVLSVCVGGVLTAALLLNFAPLAAPALLLAGLCLAPIFSTLLAWFTAVLPPRRAPYMLTLGSLGGALLPAGVGVLLPRVGPSALPWASALLALLLLGLLAALRLKVPPAASPVRAGAGAE